jgi:hypothetical protein
VQNFLQADEEHEKSEGKDSLEGSFVHLFYSWQELAFSTQSMQKVKR